MFDLTIAHDVMNDIDPAFTGRFAAVMRFLSDNPGAAPKPKSKKIAQGSRDHMQKLAQTFLKAREPRKPEPPQTIPDEVVSIILKDYFGEDEQNIAEIKRTHALSMGAENIVGDLLERYIASILEPHGWIWCSGSVAKSIDFIKQQDDGSWICLQIKNRDNSENSSSASVREGTEIKKWFRTYSRTGDTDWPNFPDEECAGLLSEEAFIAFVGQYIESVQSGTQ